MAGRAPPQLMLGVLYMTAMMALCRANASMGCALVAGGMQLRARSAGCVRVCQAPDWQNTPVLLGAVQDVRQPDLGVCATGSGSASALLALPAAPADALSSSTGASWGVTTSSAVSVVATIAGTGSALARRVVEAARPLLCTIAGISWVDPCRKQTCPVRWCQRSGPLKAVAAARHWLACCCRQGQQQQGIDMPTAAAGRHSSNALDTAAAAGDIRGRLMSCLFRLCR